MYRNASVLCQSECACLHKTVNMAVLFVSNYQPKKRESTRTNIQMRPSNEKREIKAVCLFAYIFSCNMKYDIISGRKCCFNRL